MNEQEQFWQGEFGNAYTARNSVDWWARVPFWARMMGMYRPRSVAEFGCNAGWNLMAIRATGFGVEMDGVDINPEAVKRAQAAGLPVFLGTDLGGLEAEMVFTAGVLIHIAPENLAATMQMLANHSSRYLVAIEYESDREQEVEYRGHKHRLWKRPFGKLYIEAVPGLRMIDKWDSADGFDRCAAWVLEKTQ